jgi:hypothetical protein
MVLFSVFNIKCSTITSTDTTFGDSYRCDKTCISAEYGSTQQSTYNRYYMTSAINGYLLTRPHP